MKHVRVSASRGGTLSRRLSSEKLKARVLLYPSLLGVLVFFVAPFGVVLYYAMIDNSFSREFVFLDNFRALLQNEAFRLAAKNTATFSLITVPLATALSLLLASALECRVPAKSKFRALFLSPMMVPVASIVLIWQILFHQSGTVNAVLEFLRLQPIDWLRTDGFDQAVVILLFLWKNVGYNVILFSAALGNIPREPLESAQIDGAGALRRFWWIKLRYLSSTILFVAILTLANSFKIFREVYLLTGNYPSDGLYMLQHFMNNTFRTLDYQKLSTATVLMTVVLTVILAVLFWLEERFGKDVEE